MKKVPSLFRTDTLTNIYTDDLFAKFIEQIKPKLDKIKEILQTNNGVCVLRIVFDELKEKPCIGLSVQTIALLNDLCRFWSWLQLNTIQLHKKIEAKTGFDFFIFSHRYIKISIFLKKHFPLY